MSDDLLTVINRRTAVAAVRQAAGANADRLLDSKTFYDAATSLDPDEPDFHHRIQALVQQYAVAAAPAPAAATSDRSEQWGDTEIAAATPAELAAAVEAGRLTDLGYHPSNRRRR